MNRLGQANTRLPVRCDTHEVQREKFDHGVPRQDSWLSLENDAGAPLLGGGQRQELLSTRAKVVFVYLLYGWISGIGLLPQVNSQRESMWKYTDSRFFDSSILDWFAFAYLQKNLFVSAYSSGSIGDSMMERSVLGIVSCLCLSELASAPYIVDSVSAWTALIHMSFLVIISATSAYSMGTQKFSDQPNNREVHLQKSDRNFPAPRMALVLQTGLAALRLAQMMLPDGYLGASQSCAQKYSVHAVAYTTPAAQSIGQFATQLHVLSLALLALGTTWPCARTQRALLWAQSLTWIGWMLLHQDSTAEVVGGGAGLFIAILGAIF